MKKLFVLLIFSFLLIVGCGSNRENEINEFVLNNSYGDIMEKIDVSINNINYFPNEEYEDEFIYYVKATIKNIGKFNTEEKNGIYNKLKDVSYTFKYNSLEYTNSDLENDILFFKS